VGQADFTTNNPRPTKAKMMHSGKTAGVEAVAMVKFWLSQKKGRV